MFSTSFGKAARLVEAGLQVPGVETFVPLPPQARVTWDQAKSVTLQKKLPEGSLRATWNMAWDTQDCGRWSMDRDPRNSSALLAPGPLPSPWVLAGLWSRGFAQGHVRAAAVGATPFLGADLCPPPPTLTLRVLWAPWPSSDLFQPGKFSRR